MLEQSTLRILLPLGFFGAIVGMLMLGESWSFTQATTIVVNGPEVYVQQIPAPLQSFPRCKKNNDCPLPTSYCSKSGKCTNLKNPVCDCSQLQVLRCYEDSGKARFLFCRIACVETEDGAICQ